MTRFLYVSMKESPFNKRAQMSEKCFEEHCNCTILAELYTLHSSLLWNWTMSLTTIHQAVTHSKMQRRHLDVKSRFKTLAWKKRVT